MGEDEFVWSFDELEMAGIAEILAEASKLVLARSGRTARLVTVQHLVCLEIGGATRCGGEGRPPSSSCPTTATNSPPAPYHKAANDAL